jgi:Family of unknown function (DUF5681)
MADEFYDEDVPDLDPDFEVALKLAAQGEKPAQPAKSHAPASKVAGKTADYDVGYKRTPKHTRYTESGNPRGRPKGSLGIKARIRKVLDETITVSKNGKPVKMKRLDIGLAKIAEKLMSGDVKAAAYLLNLLGDGTDGAASEAAVEVAMPDEANLEFVYRRLARRFEGRSDDDE